MFPIRGSNGGGRVDLVRWFIEVLFVENLERCLWAILSNFFYVSCSFFNTGLRGARISGGHPCRGVFEVC